MVSLNNSNDSKVLRKKVIKFGLIGGVLTFGGAFVAVAFPVILQALMNWQMVFKEGNMLTTIWANPPIGITVNIYLFNLENPNEFREGAKPRLRQMGPYAYTVRARHDIISWGPNQDSLEFYIQASFQFDPEKTVGQLSDQLTLLNLATYVAAGTTRRILDQIPMGFTVGPIVYAFMNGFFMVHGEGVIKETTVGDLLEGKHMSMLQTIDTLAIKPVKWLLKQLGITLPQLQLYDTFVKDTKFGILHMANNSKLGPWELWSGQGDPRMFNRFKSFMGKTKMNVWNDPKCNRMDGGEGISFGHPFISKQDKLSIYLGDLCRSLHATYKEMSYAKGVPLWRYWLTPQFMSPDKNPDNKCFCNTPDDYQMCDGIFDIGPCQYFVPIAISLPHLLDTSDKIQSMVEGLEPDRDKHDTFLDASPILGTAVGGMLRLQINLLVNPVPLMYSYSGLPEAVLPVAWIEVEGAAGGILDYLLIVGLFGLFLIDWGPYFAVFVGLCLLGYTSRLLFKGGNVLIQPSRESTPLEPFDATEGQTEVKDNYIYPNVFSIGGSPDLMQPIPPQYSQQQYNRRGKPETSRRTSPLQPNPDNSNIPRVILSPPGSIE